MKIIESSKNFMGTPITWGSCSAALRPMACFLVGCTCNYEDF